MYSGNTKLILKHLGFLTYEYGMEFIFQTFEEYFGFNGPIDTYSFYNKNGCFTIHNIVQRGEWGWFTSENFSKNQYKLLEKEINPNLYVSTKSWSYSRILKRLAFSIEEQIKNSGFMFGIKIR